MKNTTRLSSLMGTWTGMTSLKAAVGPYSMKIYFVMHLMPDPMRGYGCEKMGCSEIDNHVCVQHDDRKSTSMECVSLQDRQVSWSDVSAFLYFGARVDAGIPFNMHVEHNLGGWVGPLSMVFAQNATRVNTTVVDQYVVRWVDSPFTQYLHMNPNCSLFAVEDFERYMGSSAVKETVMAQANASHGQDPYHQYLKTCEHGDVKPILPLFDFSFVNDTDGAEKVEVKLDYKILTFPHKGAPMYRLFPTLQERMNQRDGDFRISGPYCYGGDPNRGWTFDFRYDSNNEDEYMTLVHGCVEGLPCLPSPAEISLGGTGVGLVHPKNKTTTFGMETFLTILVYVLSMALLVSITFHCRRSQSEIDERRRRPQACAPGPYGDLGEHNTSVMQEPLIQEDAVSESKEDDKRQEKKADVQFV